MLPPDDRAVRVVMMVNVPAVNVQALRLP